MPPNSPRVTSVVAAPSSAARRAAITPAGPAPITATFIAGSLPSPASPGVVDDDPEVVALDGVPRVELPVRARAQRPVIPRRVAGFGAGAEVAIAAGVGPGRVARLGCELPGREPGRPNLERPPAAPDRPAHAPVR